MNQGRIDHIQKSIILSERYITKAVLSFLVKNLEAGKSVYSYSMINASIIFLQICIHAKPFFLFSLFHE